MKLRNKKTGDVGICNLRIVHSMEAPLLYHSLAEVNRDWEDYETKEPLIKDEKIRKAVRAWAEANNVIKVWHEGSSVGFCDGAVSIKFHELCWEEIPKGEYNITELCGEEEE